MSTSMTMVLHEVLATANSYTPWLLLVNTNTNHVGISSGDLLCVEIYVREVFAKILTTEVNFVGSVHTLTQALRTLSTR